MKSIRRLFMFLCCATLLCAACAPSALASEAPLSIVCTIFPAYDFARQLAGDTAQVRLLLPPGSESHSYEPSPRDIIDIQQADLFLYAGVRVTTGWKRSSPLWEKMRPAPSA